MAKTLIGNIKGKDGRGIASIKKTGTTGSVDTYTITYTDGTTSTYTVDNSDSVSLQRQIVPSASIESSTTASQAYVAGDYVVVNGVLRKVTAAIAKGNAISDSNSTATTVTGEFAKLQTKTFQTKTFNFNSPCMKSRGNSEAPVVLKVCGNVCTLYVNGMTTQKIENYAALLDSASLNVLADYIPTEFDSEQQRNIIGETKPVGCRLSGSGPNLWLSKDSMLAPDSEMRFVFSWVR